MVSVDWIMSYSQQPPAKFATNDEGSVGDLISINRRSEHFLLNLSNYINIEQN